MIVTSVIRIGHVQSQRQECSKMVTWTVAGVIVISVQTWDGNEEVLGRELGVHFAAVGPKYTMWLYALLEGDISLNSIVSTHVRLYLLKNAIKTEIRYNVKQY